MNSAAVAQVISRNYGQAGPGRRSYLVEEQGKSEGRPVTPWRGRVWGMGEANAPPEGVNEGLSGLSCAFFWVQDRLTRFKK